MATGVCGFALKVGAGALALGATAAVGGSSRTFDRTKLVGSFVGWRSAPQFLQSGLWGLWCGGKWQSWQSQAIGTTFPPPISKVAGLPPSVTMPCPTILSVWVACWTYVPLLRHLQKNCFNKQGLVLWKNSQWVSSQLSQEGSLAIFANFSLAASSCCWSSVGATTLGFRCSLYLLAEGRPCFTSRGTTCVERQVGTKKGIGTSPSS